MEAVSKEANETAHIVAENAEPIAEAFVENQLQPRAHELADNLEPQVRATLTCASCQNVLRLRAVAEVYHVQVIGRGQQPDCLSSGNCRHGICLLSNRHGSWRGGWDRWRASSRARCALQSACTVCPRTWRAKFGEELPFFVPPFTGITPKSDMSAEEQLRLQLSACRVYLWQNPTGGVLLFLEC